MNFKDEYIKAADKITPDRQTIDRMKANVLEAALKKRPLPVGRIAAVGGTLAACAVITFAAVNILPRSDSSANNIMGTMNAGEAPDRISAPSASMLADSAIDDAVEDAAVDEEEFDEAAAPAGGDTAYKSFTVTADGYDRLTGEAFSDLYADEPDEAGSGTDYDFPAAGISPYEITANEHDEFDAEEPVEECPAADNTAHDAGTAAWSTENPGEMIPEPEAAPAEAPEFAAPTSQGSPDTGTNGMENSTPLPDCTLTLSEDLSECVITKENISHTYKRTENENALRADIPGLPYTILTNTADNKTYYAALSGNILIIKDEDYGLIGVYEE